MIVIEVRNSVVQTVSQMSHGSIGKRPVVSGGHARHISNMMTGKKVML
jgi:hypothetical protein